MSELVGQNFSGSYVVAVGEPSGDHQYLVAMQYGRFFSKAIDVDAVGGGPRLLEGELSFLIAIRPRRP